MPPSLLTDRQQRELTKSILSYLATGLSVREELVHQLVMEIQQRNATITADSESESGAILDVNNREEMASYAQTLERKWTSVVRLQRKVLDMETQITELKKELESAQEAVSANPHTAANSLQQAISWLPKPPAKHTLSGHRDPVTSVAFHPYYSVLASASEDTFIKIWDWELGDLERTLKGHTKTVVDLDFGGPSKNEMYLASCSSDLTIKLWDTNDDYNNVRTLTGHDHTISSVKFTHNGLHLVSASRDKSIRIWDVKTGYAIRTIVGHSEWVKCAQLSLDDTYILSAGLDQSARISTRASGEGKLLFIGHEHAIEDCVFAPATAYEYLRAIEGLTKPVITSYSKSFEYVATCSRDKTIKIWNTRQEPIITLVGHDNWVRGLAFHPGGKYLLSVSDDRTIRCWDLSQNGRCVKVVHDAHKHFVSCIKWAPSMTAGEEETAEQTTNKADVDASKLRLRRVIATASVDKDVKVWF